MVKYCIMDLLHIKCSFKSGAHVLLRKTVSLCFRQYQTEKASSLCDPFVWAHVSFGGWLNKAENSEGGFGWIEGLLHFSAAAIVQCGCEGQTKCLLLTATWLHVIVLLKTQKPDSSSEGQAKSSIIFSPASKCHPGGIVLISLSTLETFSISKQVAKNDWWLGHGSRSSIYDSFCKKYSLPTVSGQVSSHIQPACRYECVLFQHFDRLATYPVFRCLVHAGICSSPHNPWAG